MMWKFFKRKKILAEPPPEVSYETILLHDFVEAVDKHSVDPGIYDEFVFKIKDKDQTYISKLLKEINVLQHKYDLVRLIVHRFVLEARIRQIAPDMKLPDQRDVWKVLISIIPARKTDSSTVILARAGKLLEQMKIKQMELDQLQAVTKGQKADRNYFNRVIAAVGVYHKIQINRMIMLLSEFVEYYLLMREQQAHIEQEIKKQKH